MNIVMSLWTKPCTDGKAHGYNTVEDMINSLIVSANVAKKHYPEIHFYTDKLGYEWIKPHLDLLPFTKIDVCMNDVDWVPDEHWSLSKLYVYSLQKEPFIHIDNDVFLWEPFTKDFLKNDFIFQEIEWFRGSHKFYEEGLKLYKDAIHKDIVSFGKAYNCGVFGALTKEALSILKDYYEYGVYFSNSAKRLPEYDSAETERKWLASVLIEQMTIYSMIAIRKLKTDVILHYENGDPIFKFKYSHMLASSKKNPVVEQKIRERVYFKDWN